MHPLFPYKINFSDDLIDQYDGHYENWQIPSDSWTLFKAIFLQYFKSKFQLHNIHTFHGKHYEADVHEGFHFPRMK